MKKIKIPLDLLYHLKKEKRVYGKIETISTSILAIRVDSPHIYGR